MTTTNRSLRWPGPARTRMIGVLIAAGFATSCASSDDVAPATAPDAAPEHPTMVVAEPERDETPEPPIREIYTGTGQFLSPTSPQYVEAMASNAGVTLNFVNADIRDLVDAVLGDSLKLNYAIDPGVEGTVELQTNKPIPRSDLLSVLSHVLQMHDTMLVQDGNLYRVVPAGETTSGVVVRAPGDPVAAAGGSLQIVPLTYASAAAVARVMEDVKSEEVTVQADIDRNFLYLSGPPGLIEGMVETAQIFDVDWLAGMSYGLFEIENGRATDVIGDLDAVFGDTAEGPLAGVVDFVPITRLNAVLVIAQQHDYITQAQQWIERLDRVGEGAEPQLFVYRLENSKASEIAEILAGILGTDGVATGTAAELAPGLTPASIASEAFGQRTPNVGEDGDTREGGTIGEGGSLELSPAERTARVETPTVTAQPLPGFTASAVRVVADEASNAVIVLATPPDYRKVEAAIEQLDRVPKQVLIEATIAEVTLNDTLQYGIQWFFDTSFNATTLSNVATGAVGPIFPGFSSVFDANNDARVVIDALDDVTDVQMIASPQLMVLNNQTARLLVGDQVPISTRSSVSVVDPDAPVVNDIEFRDTGVILSLTPRVNDTGMVTLEVIQEVSAVRRTDTSELNSPTIQQRRIESIVSVRSNQTIALGGLIQDERTQGQAGIPLLMDIPILGNLFRTNLDENVRTELLVLITPRVVSDEVEAQKVTDELRSRLRQLEPLERRIQ